MCSALIGRTAAPFWSSIVPRIFRNASAPYCLSRPPNSAGLTAPGGTRVLRPPHADRCTCAELDPFRYSEGDPTGHNVPVRALIDCRVTRLAAAARVAGDVPKIAALTGRLVAQSNENSREPFREDGWRRVRRAVG